MKQEFYVHGMHCAACEMLIEDKLQTAKGVKDVKANLKTSKVSISCDAQISPEYLNKFVHKFGYKISNKKEETKINYNELKKGLLIAGLIFVAFLLLQKLGIVNLINPKQVTLPFVFLIGVVASVSTCMAVVGGLVLSLSSNFAKEKNFAPLMAFHVARVVGFFILGGIIGLLGSAFVLNTTAYFVMNTLLFIVMLIMGLNLLEIFPFTHALQLRMPKVLGKSVLNLQKGLQNKNGVITSTLMGIATFILPCGFTQSMQIYSLTTGSYIQGALTMMVFALGTLPVLSLISFASFKIKSKVFFTTSGFLIIMFSIFNFISGLKGMGIL